MEPIQRVQGRRYAAQDRLFDAFAEVVYERQHSGAPLELPTGCAYWNDKRMLDIMSGTDRKHFHVHGCMYGVVEQYGGQTMPRRLARKRKAIAAGRVTPMDLRNYKDNLVTARTWITTGVPSLLVWSCFACTQDISDYTGMGVVFKTIYENLTAVETQMRLGKLIENAMTKCKRLKTYTATNDKWMTVLTSNLLERSLLGGLGTFWEQLEFLQGSRNAGSGLRPGLRRVG